MNIIVDIENTILQVGDIKLRPFNDNDLNDFYEYAKVEGVGEMAGWSHHKDIYETLRVLDIFITNRRDFAITLNNKTIGSIGIKDYNTNILGEFDELKGIEIGFVLSKDYWGNGIMPKVANAVIDYSFNTLKVDVIFCGYFMDNIRSKRVQEKLGFKPYKIVIYRDTSGIEHETMINLLYKNDYINNKIK